MVLYVFVCKFRSSLVFSLEVSGIKLGFSNDWVCHGEI